MNPSTRAVSSPTPPDVEQLDRYLADECTPDERAAVEAWLASPERRLRFVALERAVVDPFGAGAVASSATVRRRVWEAVDVSPPVGETRRGQVLRPSARPSEVHPRTMRSIWYGITALAAAFALAVVGVTGFHRPGRYDHTGVAGSVLTYRTANGQRASITLPDGSLVTLNVASRLDVPADYAAGNRTVRLDGEALFTVVRHNSTPFTVLAGASATRVLGTTFLVRHYDADTSVMVAVHDGKVSANSVVLAAREQVDIARGGRVTRLRADEARFSFTGGILTLNGVLLRDAIADLDRWYDADVRLGDPVLGTKHRIHASFGSESIADLAEILSVTLHVRVARDGRTLTLYPQ